MRLFPSILLLLCVALSFVNAARVVRLGQLPLRTKDRWIVDQQGARVKLTCVNWPGAHMNTFVPQGLYARTSLEIASVIRSYGWNCVRLNWALEVYFRNPVVSESAIAGMRRGGYFVGQPRDTVRAMQVLDHVVQDLERERVLVILDNHMSTAGWCCDPRDGNGLWFTEAYPLEKFEYAWKMMAARYSGNPYVMGADLRNEIRPDITISGELHWNRVPKLSVKVPVWGRGDGRMKLRDLAPEFANYTHPDLADIRHRALLFVLKRMVTQTMVETYDWHPVATRVTSSIHRVNPNMIVFVPGVFDLHSYIPNALQLVFYYMIHDESLYKLLGRRFQIPNSVTKHYQLMNMTGIAQVPVRVPDMDRLAYSAHLYPFYYDGSQFDWDGKNPTYEFYRDTIDSYWGYIHQQSLAPVWIGEMGTEHSRRGLNSAWLNYTVRYLHENDLDFAYWLLGDARTELSKDGTLVEGGDGYSLLNHNFTAAFYPMHMESMRDLMEPQRGPGVGSSSLPLTSLVLQP